MVSVRDICKIFASIVGFFGMGHRMLPTEFFPERPSLPWQQNLEQNWLSLGLCKRYLQNFCVFRGFSGIGHRMMPREFSPERPSLPWQQNLRHNGLELGLRKKYIKDICIRWGVFKIGLFWYGQCAII